MPSCCCDWSLPSSNTLWTAYGWAILRTDVLGDGGPFTHLMCGQLFKVARHGRGCAALAPLSKAASWGTAAGQGSPPGQSPGSAFRAEGMVVAIAIASGTTPRTGPGGQCTGLTASGEGRRGDTASRSDRQCTPHTLRAVAKRSQTPWSPRSDRRPTPGPVVLG